jgi:hypothetical protein
VIVLSALRHKFSQGHIIKEHIAVQLADDRLPPGGGGRLLPGMSTGERLIPKMERDGSVFSGRLSFQGGMFTGPVDIPNYSDLGRSHKKFPETLLFLLPR